MHNVILFVLVNPLFQPANVDLATRVCWIQTGNSTVRDYPVALNIDGAIHVNRPASGGTVPHFHQMSRGPAKSADVPHFSKMVLLFLSLPIILHVCLATQQSDELRIKIGSKFARRQATDYKYTVLYRSVRQRAAGVANKCLFFQRALPHPPPASSVTATIVFTDRLRKSVQRDV